MKYDKIKKLDQLIEDGIGFEEDDRHTLKYIEWHNNCFHAIRDIYEQSSDEYKVLRESQSIESIILNLKIISTREKAKLLQEGEGCRDCAEIPDEDTIGSDVGIRILSKIDMLKENNDKKEQLRNLFNMVRRELKSEAVNWERVSELLKMSFDFGMDVAPDIVEFADRYYESRNREEE
ncbi:hypothetical protein EAL2_c15000 [Peptoclostridium acidaminophilum DSM 3953]|uniref:Uncharacterized protein n=1 Tax=Peptoclostridium acidaminophilum DSM 3953 TaxID=1286171 RepID=W8T7D5_PEPAC|nr:hypothetical protein [Peptoclostridium acidaminophilum]AHM56795.1 hypothetical protein EAL2_c15000 [Peptoclostridium acidaminophilum DSM 3953]